MLQNKGAEEDTMPSENFPEVYPEWPKASTRVTIGGLVEQEELGNAVVGGKGVLGTSRHRLPSLEESSSGTVEIGDGALEG